MGKTKIMVVDDDPDIVANLEYRLRRLGYIVTLTVPSGEEAIKQAVQTLPDLVLMDIVLEGEMDGVESGRQIQERLTIPVLYMTAHADPSTLQRARVTSPYGYVFKPFTDRELFAVIETALYRHQVERELIEIKQKQALAYELGRDLTTLLDPADLLLVTVNQLLGTLGYYHAHIYLLGRAEKDSHKDNWILFVQEGTGEAGSQMIQEGHYIPLNAERSLVAQAARSKQPVTVNDVTKDPHHLPNKLLPDTRSEVAIPLVSGETLIGVLDVQHAQVDHFDAEEIRTLQIIAGQLSIALSNARLFAENSRRSAIIENSADLIALVDMENNCIMDINPAGVKMAGYEYQRDVIGQHIDNLCSIRFNQTNEQQTVWRNENILYQANGTVVPVDQTSFIIPDDRSRRKMLATIMTDITGRKKNEETLKRFAERLQTLRDIDQVILSAQSSAEIANVTLQHIQKLIACSDVSVATFDISNKETILLYRLEKPALDGDSHLFVNEQTIKKLKQGEICTFDDSTTLYSIFEDDTASKAVVCIPLIAQGELIGVLNLGVDNLDGFDAERTDIAQEVANSLAIAIQQAKQREAIQKAENRYHSLFDGVPVGLYRTSPTGKFLDANPALVEILGYPNRESLLAINVAHTYVSSEDRQTWQDLADRSDRAYEFHVQIRRGDGTTVWARNRVNVVRDTNGAVLYYEGALVT